MVLKFSVVILVKCMVSLVSFLIQYPIIEKLIYNMLRVQIVAALSLFVLLLAQDDDNSKKRKVYRTQSGSIIEAPRPIFEREVKKKSLSLVLKA